MKKIVQNLSRPLLPWILLSLLLNLSSGSLFSQIVVNRIDNSKYDAEEHVSLRVVNIDSSVHEEIAQCPEAFDALGFGDPHTSTTLLNPSVYIDPSVTDLEVDQTIKTPDEVFQLFSHGKPGVLLINNQWLDASGIVDFVLREVDERGLDISHINIYACNFAKGEVGRQAVAFIENSLHVSLAASNDITGMGGDWDLEVGPSLASIRILDYSYSLQSASATYSSGDIPTEFDAWTGVCTIGTLEVTIPAGAEVTSVDVSYSMTADNWGWQSEQRSQIYYAGTIGTDEGGYSSGTGDEEGTQTYNRTGLTLANGVSTTGILEFEMHAYRTYEGFSGCNTTVNKVDDATWTITVYYDVHALISGSVYADTNLDGVNDNGELGQDGVTVRLYEDANVIGVVDDGTPLTTETTDLNGDFQFDVILDCDVANVRDDFSSNNNSGSIGSQTWASNWIESFSRVYFASGELVFYRARQNQEQVYREVDLSDADMATLTFDWRSVSLDYGENLSVQISKDGGAYTTLSSFGYSPTSGVFTQDISDYISSATRIKFINTSSNWERYEYVYIDNVDITYFKFSGNYVMDVESGTLPHNATMTTDNVEEAVFSFLDLSDSDNDFGFASADVAVAIDDGETSVVSGNGATYTMLVTNNAPTDATNVVLSETWPVSFTQGTIATPSKGTIGGGTPDFMWTLGSLGLGQTESLLVDYTVPITASAGDYTNSVSITSDADPVIANDVATDVTTVNEAISDITSVVIIDNIVKPDNIHVEEDVCITFDVHNLGPHATINTVEWTFELPPELEFVSSESIDVTESGGVLSGTVAGGFSVDAVQSFKMCVRLVSGISCPGSYIETVGSSSCSDVKGRFLITGGSELSSGYMHFQRWSTWGTGGNENDDAEGSMKNNFEPDADSPFSRCGNNQGRAPTLADIDLYYDDEDEISSYNTLVYSDPSLSRSRITWAWSGILVPDENNQFRFCGTNIDDSWAAWITNDFNPANGESFDFSDANILDEHNGWDGVGDNIGANIDLKCGIPYGFRLIVSSRNQCTDNSPAGYDHIGFGLATGGCTHNWKAFVSEPISIPVSMQFECDTDGDGIDDVYDIDDDNDGIPDDTEGTGDTDGDGVLDRYDLDSDNDGIYDHIEAGGLAIYDADNNGAIDNVSATDENLNGLFDLYDIYCNSQSYSGYGLEVISSTSSIGSPLECRHAPNDVYARLKKYNDELILVLDGIIPVGEIVEIRHYGLSGTSSFSVEQSNDGSIFTNLQSLGTSSGSYITSDYMVVGELARYIRIRNTDSSSDHDAAIDALSYSFNRDLCLDNDGIPIVDDSDADYILDAYDLDADNDGCKDAVEAGMQDGDDNGLLGIAAVLVSVDTLGRVLNDDDGPFSIGTTSYVTPSDLDGNSVYDFKQYSIFVVLTDQPTDQVVELSHDATFTVNATADSFLWQVDQGAGWTDLANDGLYSGVNTNTLLLTNPSLAMDNVLFRVKLSSEALICSDDTISNTAVLHVWDGLGFRISGKVFHDTTNNNKVDGVSKSVLGSDQLYIVLTDTLTNIVLKSGPVANGLYKFYGITSGMNVGMQLSDMYYNPGEVMPEEALSLGWLYAGEIQNDIANSITGNDGEVDGKYYIPSLSSDEDYINFSVMNAYYTDNGLACPSDSVFSICNPTAPQDTASYITGVDWVLTDSSNNYPGVVTNVGCDYTRTVSFWGEWKYFGLYGPFKDTCDQVFTYVFDTIPPAFTVPANDTVYKDISCSFDVSTTFTGDVSDESDNCSTGLDAMFSDDSTGLTGPSNTGIIVREWSLTDDCGNTTLLNQIITVLDTTPPEVICQDITLYLDSTGVATLSPAEVDNGSSDNCGIDTMYLNVTDFDCSDLGGGGTVITSDASSYTLSINLEVLSVTSGGVVNCAWGYNQLITVAYDISFEGNNIPSSLDNCQGDLVFDDGSTLSLVGLPKSAGSGDFQVSRYVSDSDCNTISAATLNYSHFKIRIGDSGIWPDPGLTAQDVIIVPSSGVAGGVTLKVIDLSGNSDSCSANVTLLDNIAPWATSCPVDADNVFVTLYDPADPVFIDNCGIESVTWTMSGATSDSSAPTGINYVGNYDFNEGTTVISYIATDASGNTVNCEFQITVKNSCDAAVSGNLDTDGDNVSDICDLDDDNDGILDVDENSCGITNSTLLFEDFGVATYSSSIQSVSLPVLDPNLTSDYTYQVLNDPYSNSLNDNYYSIFHSIPQSASWAASSWQTVGDHTSGSATSTYDRMLMVNAGTTLGVIYQKELTGVTSGAYIDVSFWVLNLIDDRTSNSSKLLPNIQIELWQNSNILGSPVNTGDILAEPLGDASAWHQYSTFVPIVALDNSDITVIIKNNKSGTDGNDLALDDILVTQYCDTDNDGIPDYLDTDSDNDGCPDATEAADSLETTAILAGGSNGGSSENLGTTVDSDGVPITANGGQANATAVVDSCDNYCNPFELTISNQTIDCGGCTGSYIYSISGGVAPYTVVGPTVGEITQEYEQIITFDASSALSDYPVAFNIAYDTKMQSDFSDLYFTDDLGNNLSFWIEDMVASDSAKVWVKIPTIALVNNSIRMVYGSGLNISGSDIDRVMSYGGLNMEVYHASYHNPLQNLYDERESKGVCTVFGSIDHDWGGDTIYTCVYSAANNISLGWEGWLVLPEEATSTQYTFISGSDDGLFLRLDGDSVYPFFDTWQTHAYTTKTATYSTTKDVISLSFEMFENGGLAHATFAWDYSGNSGGTTIVPGSAFRYLPYLDTAFQATDIVVGDLDSVTINKRSYLCSGVDTLTVIDSKGCSIESYVDILPDIINPVAVSCPGDISVCSTLYDPIDPEFSDNCSIAQVNWEMTGATVDAGSGYVGLYDFPEGITTLTYTAQDFSGNSVTCVSEITIDLPHFLGSSVNGPICAGEDAVFTLNGDAGDIVTFSGDTSGVITIEGGGSVDLVVMGATSNVVIDFTQISNASCDLPLSVSDTVIVYNSSPLAYDGFSDNSYGWDDNSSLSNWTAGANPTMYDISDSRASMVYEYADSGIYVDGGSDYLHTNTATNGNPDVNQSKFVSRTPLDSMNETFYISFLARFSQAPSGTWQYLAVGKKDGDDDAGVGLGHLVDSKLGFSFADNGVVKSTIDAASPSSMTTYFVVGKWTVNENGISKIDVFLNPTSLSLERSEFQASLTPSLEDSDMSSIDIQSFFADTTYFDEIRYGYSWESVVPHHILVSSDDDNIINSGEAVTFTAYGGGEYEFFLNGNSVQGPNTTATYTNSTLANADVVKVVVHHQNGCDTDTAEIITYMSVQDYGDAPASYDADSAANHTIQTVPLVYLGSVAPDEEATVTSGDGTGDDVNGSDDEDAFSFFPPYTTMRDSFTLHVPITNTSGDSVTVAAWIDMNSTGVFEVSERASITVATGVDTATLVWTSLPSLSDDASTYIRLRIASDKSELVSPNSSASDGEVEDYPFEILYAGACPTEAFLVQDAVSNWYDLDLATASYVPANDNYAGTLNGVGFNVLDGLIYGYDTSTKNGSISITSVNSTTSPTTYTTYLVGPIPGLPIDTGFYVGDVGAGNLYLRQGGKAFMYIINVDPESPGYLSEAIARKITGVGGSYTDMVYLPSNDTIYCINNSNGDLHKIDPVSGITAIVDTSCVPGGTYGAQYLDVNGFMYCSNNASGEIYRVSLTGNPDYRGVLWAHGPASGQNDGARCPNAPVPIDFGDAPASYITEISYGTQIGARHAVPLYDVLTHTAPLMLGSLIDIEINGQPSSGADGDDIDGVDDEDGVALLTSLSTTSTTYSTTVSVLNNTSHTVYLSGYIDFDGDSLFSADERTDVTISSSLPTNQDVELIWTGIGSTIDINPGSTYMRLRLSSQDTAVQVANGIAVDGEVEDYAMIINGIVTDSVTQIEETTATLYGYLHCGADIEEYGFYYSTDNNTANLGDGSVLLVKVDVPVPVDFDSLAYSLDVTGLTNRSGYYFRAYMKDASDNYTYGKVVRFLSEKRDFSLALDGDGDFLLIDSTTTHDVINDWGVNDNTFSVDFWMRNGTTVTDKMVIVSDTCHNGTNHTGYLIAFKAGSFYFQTGGTLNKTDFVVFDQEWHHVACTYNNGPVSVYIDDSLIHSIHSSLTLRRPNVAVNCKIGCSRDPNNTDKFSYFNGNIDAMRFWNVALTAEQISELCYDNVKSDPSSNTITGIASGRVITGLTADNLTASLGFNVMSTQESVGTVPVDIHYPSQDSLHTLPFFHNDARLTQDKVAFNMVAVGDAHPSPYLPRVYWRYNSTESVWLNSDNWGGYAFPGEGASFSDFPDVAANGDLPNDSAYCLYTVVDSSANSPLVTVTPPQVQVLIDRNDGIGTYRVEAIDSGLTILKGIYPEIFDVVIDNEEGSIVIEEGAMEVFHD